MKIFKLKTDPTYLCETITGSLSKGSSIVYQHIIMGTLSQYFCRSKEELFDLVRDYLDLPNITDENLEQVLEYTEVEINESSLPDEMCMIYTYKTGSGLNAFYYFSSFKEFITNPEYSYIRLCPFRNVYFRDGIVFILNHTYSFF